MTAYATVEQIKLAVARNQHLIRGGPANLDDDQLELALAQAQAEIDGRLRSRYVVPFTVVPALVNSLTIDIGAYLVSLTYHQNREFPDTDPIARRYKRACCLLDDIAMGTVVLDTDGAEHTAASTAWFGTPIDPSGGGWLSREFYEDVPWPRC